MAIAQSTISFSNSTTPNVLVTAANVDSYDTLDVAPSPTNNIAPKWLINITMVEGSSPRSYQFNFASAAARNTSVANLKTAINTVVA